MDHKDNLLDFYVDRVLKKHNVKPDSVDLSEEEKQRMKDIIENIQADVQGFLDRAEKKVTEKDFPKNSNNEEEQVADVQSEENTEIVQPPSTKPKIFVDKKENNKNN